MPELRDVPLIPGQPTIPTSASQRDDHGERRHLTVMFCDLVDSTPLASRLDPEDLRDVVHRYQRVAEESVTRHGGRIAQYLGDGVLAYFGYPTAHEDDARRAVLAALDIEERVRKLGNVDVAARIAVHSGPVVVAELAADAHGGDELIGLALNVAARLQALAEPSSVIISEATAELVRGYFRLEPLGTHALKGLDEAVTAYRPAALEVELTRFDLAAARKLTRFVGREDDLRFLQEQWRSVTEGSSSTVLVLGEPGVGKSRLVWELRQELPASDYDLVELQCSALHANTQLHPVVQHLRSRLERADAADPAEALRLLLRRAAVAEEPALSLVSSLLEIPTDPGPDLPEGIDLRRAMLLDALRCVLVGAPGARCGLVVTEDLQWADPTTLELVGSLTAHHTRRPVLVVCTARPELTARWPGRPDLHRHELARLDDDSARTMVEWLGREVLGQPVVADLAATIVRRSDGVPLFIEEVAGLLSTRTTADSPTPPTVPSTLLDLLVSRVDRLGPAKPLIQAAALIGRDFDVDLLAAVRSEDRAVTVATLDRQEVAELVGRLPRTPGTQFTFRHALVRDAAYSTLLLRQRRRLHARVGRLLIEDESREPPRFAAPPDVIAYHCREGGLVSEAIQHLHLAATRSLATGANAEAIAFVEEALTLLEGAPEGAERSTTELSLLTVKGPALMAQRGYGHAEVADTFRRAKALVDDLGDRVELFPVLYGLTAYSAVRCDLETATELAARLRDAAYEADDDDLRMLAHAASAQTDFILGRFPSAEEQAAQCIARHDPVRQAEYRFLFGEDPGTVCRGVAGWLAWLRGDPASATAAMSDTVERARALDHAFTLAETLLIEARLRHYLRDLAGLQAVVEEALAISTRNGFPFFEAAATVWAGWADAANGARSGLQRMRAGLEAYRATGTEMFVPYNLALLGEAAWRLGDGNAALLAIDEALERASRTGDLDHNVEGLRLRAVVAAQQPGSTTESAPLLHRAADLAEQQGARSLAVRVAVSQVELGREAGDSNLADEGLAALVSSLGAVPAGATSAELEHARALAAGG